jgi:xanthine dehydrogenase accessory factor
VIVLVRGVGDIGSAVAHYLFRAGYGVVIQDDPKPTTTRRGMAFADAIFDGHSTLDGVRAIRADDLEQVGQALVRREAIPVYVRPWGPLRATLGHRVLVDARMRKHAPAEVQIGYADLTVGLGPALVAGRHAHVVVETSWDGLATVITEGASLPLAGEPPGDCRACSRPLCLRRSMGSFGRRPGSGTASVRIKGSRRSVRSY